MTNEQSLIAEIHNLPRSLQDEAIDSALRMIKKLAKQATEEPKRRYRKADSHPGMFTIGPNFDDPVEGFEEYI